MLQPNEELEIGATYELTGCNGSTDEVFTSFTVSTGPDTLAPLTPIFEPGETYSSNDFESFFLGSCGKREHVSLEVISGASMLVLDIAFTSTFDAVSMSGAPLGFFFPGEPPRVGKGTCPADTWDFDEKGDAVSTRLGAFDLAGNFSGMSDPQTVAPGCSYAAAGTPNSSGYALVVLGGFVLIVLRGKRINCGAFPS